MHNSAGLDLDSMAAELDSTVARDMVGDSIVGFDIGSDSSFFWAKIAFFKL